MTTREPTPGSGDESAAVSRPAGRTRRSLLGLGGVVAGAVVGSVVLGTRANAFPVCFLRGTMIQTRDGERAIEDLAIGDCVITVSGAVRPVKWIGRMSFTRAATRTDWVRDVVPVRLAKGSINGDLPSRDLYVSQKHSLYLDGVLVMAGSLVGAKGIEIAAPAGATRLDYFHVELDSHDVIYADGVPAETFREAGGNRESFANFAEYERMHGRAVADVASYGPIVGFSGTRDRAKSYLRSALSPFIDRRTVLDRIRDRLMERAR